MLFTCLCSSLLSNTALFSTIIMVLLIIPGLYICYWIWFGLTIKMAKDRHRDPLGWVILSFFNTPIWVWIILLIAGDKGT